MTDLAVRTLRMHGTSPRPAAENLLRAMLPTDADRSVLIARRLVLTGSSPAEARRRLDDLRRRAARPVAARVDPAADAVLFRDEVDLLACLTADLRYGVAHDRWYWRSWLPRAATGSAALAQVWLAEIRWLPAVLSTLERRRPALAGHAVAWLTPAEAESVLAALLAVPADPPAPVHRDLRRVGTPAAAPAAASTRSQDPVAYAEGRPIAPARPLEPSPPDRPPARWLRMVPAATVPQSPTGRALLAAAAVLAAEPAARRDVLRAWVRTLVAPDTAPHCTPHPDPRPGPPPLPAPPALPDLPPIAPRPAPDPASRRAAPPGVPPAASPVAEDASGEPVHTGHAGLFYLLNLMRRYAEDDLDWAGFADFGRHLLRGRPRARRHRDPIWTVLRDLAGLDRLPPPRPRTWWPPARGWLGEHHLGPATFEQPGRLLITDTHVDVVLGVDQIDLDVRIAGLDQDPGWMPRLGRIVAFHFEDRP
ncbi:hypothetical protein [Micromonospora sp. NPDC005806]|uniref:hypothetical protein n=1 Tax=Micromonospora sp. NPDC005806 TaxID=3364234 RepID=UPI0036BC4957